MAAVPSPPATAPSGPRDARTLALAAALVAATVFAYFPALSGALIWNDADYVTKPALRSLAGLGRIWTEPGSTEQYYPLLHSAFWLQYRLWGEQPLGYHLATLGLHVGAALLFVGILRRLAVPGAWLAGFLFALHPVHTESVAWITEQKNTLSLVFYLAAATAYLRFDETRSRHAYAGATVCFVLSLLCKTVTATLPAALLVVLWWRRGRIGARRDLAPLLPWLVVGAAAGLFSSWVEQHYLGARGENFALPFLARGLVAGRAVWFYLGQLVWPAHLNFIYPRWAVDPRDWTQWLYPATLLLLASGLWRSRGRSRAPLAALLIFTGSLFPVLGFVNLYGGLYSWVWDHWQYLPDLAPLALLAAGLTLGWAALVPRGRELGPVVAGLLVAGLGFLTWRHTVFFRDEETLYRKTLVLNPAAWMVHNNLANLLALQPGHETEAVAHYNEALDCRPDYVHAHANVAKLLARLPGGQAAARRHFEEVLRLQPGNAEAHNELANLLSTMPGRQAEAIAHYEEALRLSPGYAIAHNNLANLLSTTPGRQAEAIAHYEEALRLDPGLAEAHSNLANMIADIPGRQAEALAHYGEALRLKPDFPEAHNNLANILAKIPGRQAEAMAHYGEALRLNPGYAQAHANLANLLLTQPGREAEVIAHCRQALERDPRLAMAYYVLALLEVRQAHPGEAAHLCRLALQNDPGYEEARRLLAGLETAPTK